jgi:hypothetical protein
VELVHGHVFKDLGVSAQPADLDAIDAIVRAQAEVQVRKKGSGLFSRRTNGNRPLIYQKA